MAIILDVQMPTCCVECPCYSSDYDICSASENDTDNKHICCKYYDNSKPDWCPIHGEIYLVCASKSHDCCLWNEAENKCNAGFDIDGCPDNDECTAFD